MTSFVTVAIVTLSLSANLFAQRTRPTTDKRAGDDWWSLQPVRRIDFPQIAEAAGNPIDAFILAKLKEKGLALEPPADRRTLIRRLSFDLRGLPPSPAELREFLNDPAADAYQKQVDRMLASPQYGERWARHWLDIARFGESNGFERDQLRPNAWRYRDWVIRAFNSDLPYNEFARMQIAGDVLHPADADGIIATGFLVGGPYDQVGQTQQSAAMRAVVRQDEMEDLVGTTAQTFLGLTANCARCHDHKFDPIRQQEYYRLSAALAGVQQGERDLPAAAVKSEVDARGPALQARIDSLSHELAAIEDSVRTRLTSEREAAPKEHKIVVPPPPIAEWNFGSDLQDHLGSMHGSTHGDAHVENKSLVLNGQNGFVLTAPLQKDLREKTLAARLSLHDLKQRGGAAISLQTLDGNVFDAIVFGEREPGHWMAGSDGFRRTQPFFGSEETEANAKEVQIAITYASDGTITCYRNGAPYGRPYKGDGPVKFKAGQAQVSFGLRHLPEAPGKLLAGNIFQAAIYDRALTADEVARVAGLESAPVGEAEIAAALSADQKERREQLRHEIAHLISQQARLASTRIYSALSAAPQVTHVLKRGNPAQEEQVVAPGGIAAVRGVTADFGLPPDASDAQRRIKLAEWITDAHNPLFARVIVNRLWQYHLGIGLVETPNDLGFNGGRPTHPELLDWLASELVQRQWSLKQMQRLIVTSATYRQASHLNGRAMQIDGADRFLWRFPPRRLEAEALRDTVLDVAGELNPQVGGPSYEDYFTFTSNTQFYEPRDYVGASFNRRSVYRTWVRSGRNPLLDVLDCPDPSTRSPHRPVTITPLQALSLQNDSFMLRMSDRLAERLHREAGDDPAKQVTLAYDLAFGRSATGEEIAAGSAFIRKHRAAPFCRVLFNSNEFVFID